MKKLKAIYIIFLLFPLINLITGLMTRHTDFPLTIGVIIRVALLVFLVFYIFFLSNSKYKKLTVTYFIALFLFAILYLLTKPEYFSLRALYNEANLMFKFMYFPILLLGMLNLCDEYKFDIKKWQKIFLIGLIFYLIFIIFPVILQSSFNSYVREQYGLVGWFYAANEVGPILLMLYPATFSLLEKNKVLFLIISAISILTILATSTKVTTLGLGIIIIAYIVLYFIFNRKKISQKLILTIVGIIYLILSSPLGDKMYANIENYNSAPNPPTIEIEPPKTEEIFTPSKPQNQEITSDFLSTILSNRNKEVEKINNIYMSSNITKKFLGIGFYNTETQISDTIEMDFFDIFYHYGIIGFLILCFPYLLLLINIIKAIKNKKCECNIKLCYPILIFGLILSIGFLAGHVISAPAVSSFLVIYYLYIFFLISVKESL